MNAITNADKVARRIENRNTIERKKCADPARRKRLEKRGNEKKWLKWYLAETYPRPFEKPHDAMIEGIIEADEQNARFAEALERGIGKSVVGWGMVLYLKFTGKRKFPACVPWADKAMKRAFRFWKNAVCFNQRLLADYPEYCQPFAHARGVAQRVPNVAYKGEGKLAGAQLAVGDGIIVFPDGLGCIGGATINGNIRGLNHPQEDGTVLRPDFIFIDDVQDRGTAKSPIQVADTIAIIDGDVAGCGDAGKDLAMVMACNCICPEDVPAHYLKNSEWKALRIPCIEKWPDGWEEPNSAAKAAWDEWVEIWRGGGDDLAFYKKNKAAMTAGMVLSAPAAFKGSDKCPDAFYGVIRMFYRMGYEAFMAERQQAPIDVGKETKIRVTPEIIVSRAIGPARCVRPDGSIHVVAGADINPGTSGRLGSRITWVAAAFQMYQSECVIAYGIHRLNMPPEPTPSQQVTCVYNGLNEVRTALGNMGVEAMIYDARGWYNKGVTRGQALRYANVPFPSSRCIAVPAEGWPHEAYRPSHKTAIRQLEGCHIARDRVEQQTVSWVAWDADWHNLQQLRAWLAAPGAPGACIIHNGHHDGEFLRQCTTRAFSGMVQKHSGQVYDWVRSVGSDDYGDCLAMCRVGAAYFGIGTGGQIEQARRRKVYSASDFRK